MMGFACEALPALFVIGRDGAKLWRAPAAVTAVGEVDDPAAMVTGVAGTAPWPLAPHQAVNCA
jgi:hypothetical protein